MLDDRMAAKIFDIVFQILDALESGDKTARAIWRLMRREMKGLWRDYIRPAVKNMDLEWVRRAQLLATLLSLVAIEFFNGPMPTLKGRTALTRVQYDEDSDPREILKDIAKRF